MTGRLATLAVIFGIVLALVPGAARTQEDVGSLAITGSVDGAEIFVGEQRIGTLRAGYALVADNVPSGPQRVTARRSGYRGSGRSRYQWRTTVHNHWLSDVGSSRKRLTARCPPSWSL